MPNIRIQSILFVCMGNICRSPMAQTIMEHLLEKQQLTQKYTIDSAGILDYHEGERADRRMIEHANMRGYCITHRSRPVQHADFEQFDLILGMDNQNIRDLQQIARTEEERGKIRKLTDFCPHLGDSVPDPYYGGASGFELVIDMLEVACANLIIDLERQSL